MSTDFEALRPQPSAVVQFEWAGESVVGKVRKANEDSFICREGVFVVADGMGGHDAGEVASQLVVDRFSREIDHVPIAFSELERIVVTANADVRGEAVATSHLGMGATLVAAVWVMHEGSPYLAVVNVGDSRCYLDDNNGFRCITHDHSLVQDLVDRGVITSAEAKTHPDRNVVTRAMGVDEDVVADYLLLPAGGRQRLLLCSDGVSGQLSDGEIMDAVATRDTPSDAVRAMIEAVMDGVALDNATAVVVDVNWAREGDGAWDEFDVTNPRSAASTRTSTDEPSPDLDVSDGLIVHAVSVESNSVENESVENEPGETPATDRTSPLLITSVPRATISSRATTTRGQAAQRSKRWWRR